MSDHAAAEESSSSAAAQKMERESSLGMQRESSMDVDDLDQLAEEEIHGYGADGEADDVPERDDEGLNLPPGRMHATRSATDIRLKSMPNTAHQSLPTFSVASSGGASTGNDASSLGSESSGGGSRSSSRGRTRSASGFVLEPHPHSPRSTKNSLRAAATAATTATTNMGDGNSSISSLEDIVDSDILYDRGGFQDDVLSASSAEAKQQRKSASREFINLGTVNERLSEDTLEDVHAFSDVKIHYVPSSSTTNSSSNASRANSITTADNDKAILDPLVEEDELENDVDDEASLEDPSENPDMPPVILTNMENLSLQAQSASSLQYGNAPSSTGAGNETEPSEAGRSSCQQPTMD